VAFKKQIYRHRKVERGDDNKEEEEMDGVEQHKARMTRIGTDYTDLNG